MHPSSILMAKHSIEARSCFRAFIPHIILVSAFFLSSPKLAQAGRPEDCGCFMKRWVEIAMLHTLRGQTPDAESDIVSRLNSTISPFSLTASDGVRLSGYKIICESIPQGKGNLLFAQGDAMLASDLGLLNSLQKGLCGVASQIYLFDYRGTGLSGDDTRSCLVDIIYDYKEIIDHLTKFSPGSPLLLYGVSGGGVVMINAAHPAHDYSRLVLDSVPDRIKAFSCWNKAFNPLAHLPRDASRVLVISSASDKVVEVRDMKRLIQRVKQSGGRSSEMPDLPHFHEDNGAQRGRRLEAVSLFMQQ